MAYFTLTIAGLDRIIDSIERGHVSGPDDLTIIVTTQHAAWVLWVQAASAVVVLVATVFIFREGLAMRRVAKERKRDASA